MYNQTTVEWLKDVAVDGYKQSLRYYEIILVSIFAVFAILRGHTRGRQLWMNVINVLLFFEGLTSVFYPEKMLAIVVTGAPDAVHIQLTRGIGIILLFWCINYWLLYRSTDSTVQTSLIWATAMNAGCVLLALAYFNTHPPKPNSPITLSERLTSPYYSHLIYTVVTFYYALKSTDWGGFGESSSLTDLHLKANFVLLTVVGLLLYALPQWILRISMTDIDKIDALHAYLARVAGSLMISMGILTGRTANFLRPSDKEAHMLSHWMYFVTAVLGCVYELYLSKFEATWLQIGLQTGLGLTLIMNAAGALDNDPSVVRRVFVPRVKGLYSDTVSLFKIKKY